MTTTEIVYESADMKISRFSKVLQDHFRPTKNIYHSRVYLFWAKQETKETPEQHWKKVCEQKKNCTFKDTTPANFLVSNRTLFQLTPSYESKHSMRKSQLN